MINKYTASFLLIIGFAAPLIASDIRSGDVTIKSDYSILNFRNNRSEFTGNVVINSPEFSMKADKVIEYKQNGLTVRAEAYGRPVRFTKYSNTGETLLYGVAESGQYIRQGNKIILFNYKVTNKEGTVMSGRRGQFLQ